MIRHDREVGDNVSGCAFDVLQGWICFFGICQEAVLRVKLEGGGGV